MVQGLGGVVRSHQTVWLTDAQRDELDSITIRGGGHPKQATVLAPVSRMGPPPRSFAADAHDCIMVRSRWTYRIQGCGAMIIAN
jgi:hypothetical protein